MTALTPIMVAVLVGFVVIGAALPVLPLHVRDTLGFGPVIVGIVAGCQFAAALVARLWSGHAADTKGAKWAVIAGLLAATAAGLLYLLSLSFVSTPTVSVVILLAGRAVLGGAESFIITGATTWGLVRVGAHNSGKVIAWMGTAMFAAFAGGAPLGTVLYTQWRLRRGRIGHGYRTAGYPASDCAASGGHARKKRPPEHPVRRQSDLVTRAWCRPG